MAVEKKPTSEKKPIPKKITIAERIVELKKNKDVLEKRLQDLDNALVQNKQSLIATIGALQELEKFK